MAFKLFAVLACIGLASAYVAPLTLISSPQLAPLSIVQIPKDAIIDRSAAAPLVIENLKPLNSSALQIFPSAAPLAYYAQGLVNSAPLAYSAPIAAPLGYSAPLIVNSAPIAYPSSGTYLTQSVFKPVVNVTYAAAPLQPIAYPAP